MAFEVFTTPTRDQGTGYSRPITKYHRIVGIVNEGETMWSKVRPDFPADRYDPNSIISRTLDLPERLAERMVSFFDRYFSEQPKLPIPDGTHDPLLPDEFTDDYNCHRFAYWMRGVPAAQRIQIPDAPDHIPLEGIEVTRPLRTGEHGVVGKKSQLKGQVYGAAFHSVIGLGTNECLQVTGTGGHIGITTHEGVIADYTDDWDTVKMFVRGF